MSLYAELKHARAKVASLTPCTPEWVEAMFEVNNLIYAMNIEAAQEEYADRVETK